MFRKTPLKFQKVAQHLIATPAGGALGAGIDPGRVIRAHSFAHGPNTTCLYQKFALRPYGTFPASLLANASSSPFQAATR